MPPWFNSFGWQTIPILLQEAFFVYLRIALSFFYHSHSEWYLTKKYRHCRQWQRRYFYLLSLHALLRERLRNLFFDLKDTVQGRIQDLIGPVEDQPEAEKQEQKKRAGIQNQHQYPPGDLQEAGSEAAEKVREEKEKTVAQT